MDLFKYVISNMLHKLGVIMKLQAKAPSKTIINTELYSSIDQSWETVNGKLWQKDGNQKNRPVKSGSIFRLPNGSDMNGNLSIDLNNFK